jgi:hypothetical protein
MAAVVSLPSGFEYVRENISVIMDEARDPATSLNSLKNMIVDVYHQVEFSERRFYPDIQEIESIYAKRASQKSGLTFKQHKKALIAGEADYRARVDRIHANFAAGKKKQDDKLESEVERLAPGTRKSADVCKKLGAALKRVFDETTDIVAAEHYQNEDEAAAFKKAYAHMSIADLINADRTVYQPVVDRAKQKMGYYELTTPRATFPDLGVCMDVAVKEAKKSKH